MRKKEYFFSYYIFTFKHEEEIKRKEKTTYVLTIKENHFFFNKSLVLLQLEHSGNMYALQYYSDYVAYLPYTKIL